MLCYMFKKNSGHINFLPCVISMRTKSSGSSGSRMSFIEGFHGFGIPLLTELFHCAVDMILVIKDTR